MTTQSYFAPTVIRRAEDVQDMATRVIEVLRRDPRDSHYAGEKMHRAFVSTATTLIEDLDVDGEALIAVIRAIMEANA